MNDDQFRAFLILMMCSDPWPVDDGENQVIIENLADYEAVKRGFGCWIDAYHALV